MSASAHKAVQHILRRMRADGRLAYLLGEGSESYELLTAAYAEHNGLDVGKFREDFAAALDYEPWPERAA
ncbi:MAG: hypothetical protein ACT4NV_14855 [Rhodoferax sp.]